MAETPTCEVYIKKCEVALDAKNVQIKVLERRVGELSVQYLDLGAKLDRAERSAEAWYNNKLLWVVLGAAGGYLVFHK